MSSSGTTKVLMVGAVSNPPPEPSGVDENLSREAKDWANEVKVAQQDFGKIRKLCGKCWGVKPENITQLANFQVEGSKGLSTRENILRELGAFTAGAHSGQGFIFVLQGHGWRTSEEEFYFLPSDAYDEKGDIVRIITARDLRQYLVDCLPPGVKMVIILDCCKSGNALGLPYVYQPGCSASKDKPCDQFFLRKKDKDIVHDHTLKPCYACLSSTKRNESIVIQLSPVSRFDECFESDQGGPTARPLEYIFNSDIPKTYGNLLFLWSHWIHGQYERLNEDCRKAGIPEITPPRHPWISSMTELGMDDTFVLSKGSASTKSTSRPNRKASL